MPKFLLAFLLLIALPPAYAQTKPAHTLWYDQPAKAWEEALPLGNGRLGAMVFGQPAEELIQLNEATLWTGGPANPNPNPEAFSHLAEVRRLLFAGALPQRSGPAPFPNTAAQAQPAACLRQEPGATLAKLCVWLAATGGPAVSQTMLWRAVQALDWRRKKRVSTPPRATPPSSRATAGFFMQSSGCSTAFWSSGV